MSDDNDRRHCVFKMHVHLVFVTKYRRRVFDGDAIDRLRIIFAKTCADFQAQLIKMDGKDDHVHLPVEDPAQGRRLQPREQLEGRVQPKEQPGIQKRYRNGALWSPSYFASSCGGAPISIVRQYIEQQQTPH